MGSQRGSRGSRLSMLSASTNTGRAPSNRTLKGVASFRPESFGEQSFSQIQSQPARFDQHLGRPLVGIAGKADAGMFQHQRGVLDFQVGGFPGRNHTRSHYPACLTECTDGRRSKEELAVFKSRFRYQAEDPALALDQASRGVTETRDLTDCPGRRRAHRCLPRRRVGAREAHGRSGVVDRALSLSTKGNLSWRLRSGLTEDGRRATT